MPITNIRIILIVMILSLVLASRTSIREQVLLNAYRKIQDLAFAAPSEQDVFEGALDGMTTKLRTKYGDAYSAYENYKDHEKIRESLENQLVGLGVSLIPLGKSQGVQLFPLPNSPALEAGIKYGDLLLEIDGDDITGLAVSDISKKLVGEPDSQVTLLVRHFDSEEEAEITVTRGRMQLPSVTGDRLNRDGTWNYTLETNPDIGYIAIDRTFSDLTAVETAGALDELKKANVKGLIIDLRGNPGGYLNAAVGVCSLFLNEGTIVTTKQRRISDTISANGSAAWDKPVVVLIDSMSASASEIVAACLQDHNIAVVVGSRSYGKGTVQEMIKLPLDLGTLRLTKAEYLRPSQKNINRQGSAPESDEWGVMPNEGYQLDLSDQQALVTYRIRNLRSIIPGEEAGRQIDRLVQRVKEGKMNTADHSQLLLDDGSLAAELPVNIEETFDDETPENNESDNLSQEQSASKTSNKTDTEKNANVRDDAKPFVLEGTPPYYDPQLDRAIEYFESLGKL